MRHNLWLWIGLPAALLAAALCLHCVSLTLPVHHEPVTVLREYRDPFAAAENWDAETRMRMQGAALEAAQRVGGNEGMYIDWSRGARLVVQVVDADEAKKNRILQRSGNPEWVIIEDASFRRKDLQTFVNACAELLWDKEVRVWGWGAHTMLNGIFLAVDPVQLDDAERILLENALELWREIDPEADFAPTVLLMGSGPIELC